MFILVNETEMIKMAVDELPQVGIHEKGRYKISNFLYDHCDTNLCPYIYFLPKAKNILSVNGLSASGSMVIDDVFMSLLIGGKTKIK